ncbi:MAG: rhodanese-like domain-containing protein [Gammaproteobacteria bacterium]|nr:rhodanese-like domain-containing protein [Gammaproteobacteria bacterium]
MGGVDEGLSVAAFYGFHAIDDVGALRDTVEETCAGRSVRGTVLVAPEGVNATLAGRRADLEYVIERHFRGFDVKWSSAAPGNPVFQRLKVRRRREIVTFDRPLNPSTPVGKHVCAATWNAMITDPEVIVLDVRNDYESDIGTFKRATRAATGNFRDFPDFVNRELAGARRRPVAMFCTGGIRCEKASAYLLARGFEDVSQLDGGILKYLAETEPADSAFEGECFVFDERVSVTGDLDQGSFELCGNCGRPVPSGGEASGPFALGLGCPACQASGRPPKE